MNKKTLTVLLLVTAPILFIAILSLVKQMHTPHTHHYDVYGDGQHKTIQGKFATTKGCVGIVNGILLPEFADKCEEAEDYKGKIVEIKGYVYKKTCKPNMQCGSEKEMKHIESIRIIRGITAQTDKTEYKQEDVIKLAIENSLDKNVCFELCNTYYFQKKSANWTGLATTTCEAIAIAECIDRSGVKEFEIKLSGIDFEKGTYRIAVPVYLGCKDKKFPCKDNKTIYSNEFRITENKESTAPKDKKSCKEQGGVWRKIGLDTEKSCNLPTSDADKECSNSSECEGSCIAELSKDDLIKVEKGTTVHTNGKCSAWKIIVGCHPFVENGKVTGILCVD